jgi:biopolymer transport protein ExbD
MAGLQTHMNRRVASNFKIQITSMVDMFVILLVFLLKSYTTSPITINASKELTLANSTVLTDPEDVLKLVVSQNGIFVDDKKIMDLKDGVVQTTELDANDDSYIPTLFKALDDQALKVKDIAKVNEAVEFDGKVLVQADRGLNYDTLQKVMYTSMMAGYSDVKLAVLAK